MSIQDIPEKCHQNGNLRLFYVLSGKIKYSKDLRGGGNVFSEINLCEIYVVLFYIYICKTKPNLLVNDDSAN